MTGAATPLPRVRLRSNANARAIARGFPWVFANEIVSDRRTRALAPGSVCVLETSERRPLGVFAVNPGSKIVARHLDPDPEAVIDGGWLAARLRRAASLRTQCFTEPFYRLVHAEGDGLPGLVIDRFGEVCVVQPNTAWAERMLEHLALALGDELAVQVIVKNASGRGRALEGLDTDSGVLLGTPPSGPLPVQMNGATYMADLLQGQKTGLFFDQRPNHAFAARLARGGARVLDVFSHVGGFSLACLVAGAGSALAVDGSAPALDLARAGAVASGVAARFETRQADAFAALSDLAEAGRRFDLVICDPPAFAPSRQALEAGLRAYQRVARLAAPLVAEGGYLVLCSCSHAADLARFQGACLQGIARARRRAQLIHTGGAGPDHPMLPQLAESGYLKALFFRL